jgi:hypothetical protein
MRRIIASVALVMSAFAVCSAQEMNVNIYSRLDANKPWPLESSTFSNNRINWGNSSLYLMTEGSFSEKLTFDVSLNFLNSDPEALYTNTGSCTELNWLDWADFSYSFDDRWSVSAGKQVMLANGWEFDPYDVEQHLDLCSMDWMLVNVYQWGGTVTFAPADEHSYALQVTASPLREGLFDSGEIAVNAQTRHSWGNYSGILSVNYIQTPFEECSSLGMMTLGSQFATDTFAAFLDITGKTPNTSDFGALNTTLTAGASYSFLDGALEIGAKGGYETISSKCPDLFGYADEWNLLEEGVDGIVPLGITPAKDYGFGGLFVHYSPLEDLRLHAAVACNNYTKAVSATIGVLYTFAFKVF